MSTAKEIIDLALSEVGYHEERGNINKYAAYIDSDFPGFYNGRKNGYAWCDVFVDYLFLKSFGLDEALRLTCQPLRSAGAGCKYSMGYYKSHGRFSSTPVAGSQIFFKDSSGEVNHTGIVTAVTKDSVWTVEGNTSDMVAERMYYINHPSIAGYGVPDYSGTAVPEKPATSLDDIVREVLNGKWGNGEDRRNRLTQAGYDYDEVQRAVNDYLSEDVDSKPIVFLPMETVYHLQSILKANDYEVDITGKIDEKTSNALKDFADKL